MKVAFDPDAHYESLDHFAPMVRDLSARGFDLVGARVEQDKIIAL